MNEISKVFRTSTLAESIKLITNKLSSVEKDVQINDLEERKIMLRAQEETHLFLEKLLFIIKECEDLIETENSDEITTDLINMKNITETYLKLMSDIDPDYYKNFLHTTLSVLESSIKEQIETIEIDTQTNLTAINRMKKANIKEDQMQDDEIVIDQTED